MIFLDYCVFFLYMSGILGIGVYFFRKNKNREDYFVGSRSMPAHHVGLSIVATDVGGGFSIGLAGLGFSMGLSGSWLLFTGLVGAWFSAVFIIPRIKAVDEREGMLTYPDFLRFKYNGKVALLAALISGIGYLGFTGAQILAGAKLAAATLFYNVPVINPLHFSLFVIAGVIIAYTVLGGIKAVIYTDTVQWIILLAGLIFFAIPFGLYKIGGIAKFIESLPKEYFSLTNISLVTFLNWMITIIPIWVVAMTVYQRMYACKNVKEAKKAWFTAGLFEYPVMAFAGVLLGMIARVAIPGAEPEMGVPLLLQKVLPVGITGIVVAAYFSAIMSTADSCLIASSGNVVNDIIERYFLKNPSDKKLVVISQIATLLIGTVAISIALSSETVLGIILHTYSFMVAGLLVPTIAALFFKRCKPAAAIASMLSGGTSTLLIIFFNLPMPFGLHSSFYGIVLSGLVFFVVNRAR